MPVPTRDDVRETYDRIAAHFAQTREYAWPEVEAFVDGRSADVALDVGCGNARHAELLAARATRVVGADASAGMLRTATDRAADRGFDLAVVQADATALPLGDDAVGLAVYVATLHHLPDAATRRASLDELARVLAPGGSALVSAWSTEHDRFAHRARGDESRGFDATVDWTLPGGETVPRFYHVYAPAELRGEIRASGLELGEFEVSSGNCYAEVRAEE